MSSKNWFGPVKGYSLLDQMTQCGVCECPVNLMLGPVICIPLLDRMSIQHQFTLANTDIPVHNWRNILKYISKLILL